MYVLYMYTNTPVEWKRMSVFEASLHIQYVRKLNSIIWIEILATVQLSLSLPLNLRAFVHWRNGRLSAENCRCRRFSVRPYIIRVYVGVRDACVRHCLRVCETGVLVTSFVFVFHLLPPVLLLLYYCDFYVFVHPKFDIFVLSINDQKFI